MIVWERNFRKVTFLNYRFPVQQSENKEEKLIMDEIEIKQLDKYSYEEYDALWKKSKLLLSDS